MKRMTMFFLFFVLTGCAKNEHQVDDSQPKLPGNTFANFSPPVKQDLLNNISAWVTSKDCSNFQTKDTKHTKTDGEILVDEHRRLMQGVLYETWVIIYCDTSSTLGLVVKPDGSEGTWIAIAEL